MVEGANRRSIEDRFFVPGAELGEKNATNYSLQLCLTQRLQIRGVMSLNQNEGDSGVSEDLALRSTIHKGLHACSWTMIEFEAK